MVRKSALSISVCIVLTAAAAETALAAPNDNNSRSTVTTTNGATVSQGSAGFDSAGTQAASSSTTNVGPASALVGTGSGAPDMGAPTIVIPVSTNQQAGGLVTGIGTSPPIPTANCPAGQTAFFVATANSFGTGQIVCAANQAAAPPQATTVSPLQLAEEASAKQAWPNLQVSANPASGLTGLPSWFWCAGNATMADASASAGPLTVTVHAMLADVTWQFGDGTTISGDLGRAFPMPSDIQHMYETDSAGLGEGYQLVASLRWRVTFSINGGPFSDLGIKTRDYTRTYAVQQLQPQAVSVP